MLEEVFFMEKQTQRFIGGIDSLDNGVLNGWAANELNPAPITVAAYCNGKLLGQGMAENLRPDLKKAQIHDGLHGFKFDIDTEALVDSETLILKEVESDEPIKTNEFKISVLRQNFSAEIQNVNGNQLLYSISSEDTIGEKLISVFCDGEEVGRQTIHSNKSVHQDHFWLPAKVFDNQKHLLEIAIKGYAKPMGAATFTLKPVLTPWMYLKDSHKKARFHEPTSTGRQPIRSTALPARKHSKRQSIN